jgi:thymidine kinase
MKQAKETWMAKLYFHYSTMNAGKSTMLLQASYNYQERGMRTVIMLAAFDDRAGRGKIASRIGLEADAVPFEAQADLFAAIEAMHAEGPLACVFVDEAHFMTAQHVWQLAHVVDRLDIPVMTYGLRTDFRGKLFPASQELLAIADELREVRTICHCARKATMVVRFDAHGKVLHDGAQIEIGGNEKYVSLCRRHWEEAMGDA